MGKEEKGSGKGEEEKVKLVKGERIREVGRGESKIGKKEKGSGKWEEEKVKLVKRRKDPGRGKRRK